MRGDVLDGKSSPSTGHSIKVPLRVLIVEDSEFDAQMMVSILRKGGYDVSFERVETADALRTALHDRAWDMILADYNLPDFDAPTALRIFQETGPKGGKLPNYATVPDKRPLPPTTKAGNTWTPVKVTPDSKR